MRFSILGQGKCSGPGWEEVYREMSHEVTAGEASDLRKEGHNQHRLPDCQQRYRQPTIWLMLEGVCRGRCSAAWAPQEKASREASGEHREQERGEDANGDRANEWHAIMVAFAARHLQRV